MPLLKFVVVMVGAVLAGATTVVAAASLDAPHAQLGPRLTQSAATPAASPTELTGELVYEFLMGEVALQRGQPQVAAQAYLDLARRTRDPGIAKRATEIGIFARAPGVAVEAAKLWADSDPESEDAPRAVGALLVGTSRFDEAQPYLERVLTRSAANPSARNQVFRQLGQMVLGAADKPGALRLVQRLSEPYAKVPDARLAVARAAVAANDDTLALAEVRAASDLEAESEDAVLLEASILQKQSASAATARLRLYLERFPGSREVRLNYARALAGDKQYDAARGEFQRLTRENPDNVDVIYAIGLLSLQLEDLTLAETQFKRLLDLPFREPNLARLYLGQIAEDRKRFPDAIEWYRQIDSGEQYIPAQVRLAGALSKSGDLAAGRSTLQNATATNPQQRLQLQLAESQLLRDANRSQEAFEFVERLLATSPNSIELLYDYAMIAEKLDRVDVMETNLRKVISIDAKHAHAHNALGYSLAERNIRLAEARTLIEEALKLTPEDFYIIDSLGWVLYRQGDLDGARRELERAYTGRPDAEIAAHLGEVWWMLGRRADAEKLWREALNKSPDNDSLKKTMQRFLPTTATTK